jgi:hypothetical protein
MQQCKSPPRGSHDQYPAPGPGPAHRLGLVGSGSARLRPAAAAHSMSRTARHTPRSASSRGSSPRRSQYEPSAASDSGGQGRPHGHSYARRSCGAGLGIVLKALLYLPRLTPAEFVAALGVDPRVARGRFADFDQASNEYRHRSRRHPRGRSQGLSLVPPRDPGRRRDDTRGARRRVFLAVGCPWSGELRIARSRAALAEPTRGDGPGITNANQCRITRQFVSVRKTPDYGDDLTT